MRAVKEQPRLVVVRVLAVLCLLGVGIAIGAVARGEDRDAVRAVEVRLVGAQREARDQRSELQRIAAELEGAVAARSRAKRALDRQRRANVQLRAQLKIARRAREARRGQ
jgi:hypothetical protein